MPPSIAPKTNILRRFRRNRRGSAAVEFALVAPIFFAVLFAIIELALVFFATQILETVTQDTARLIMTGQAQNASYTQAQFKNDVCSRLTVMFDCVNGISIDVKNYPTFAAVDITDPIDAGKNFVAPNNYLPGGTRRHRRRAAVLQMAAVRHRPGLQRLEYRHQPAAVDCDRRVPERTLLGRPRAMKPMRTIWLRMRRRAFELLATTAVLPRSNSP